MLNELKSLRVNKGEGLDNIPPRLLKAAAGIIAPSLTYIFNLSLSKGVFPQDFKVAKVTPLFKSGSRDQVGNYRPISVLPIAAKVFEKEVYKQLYKYLTDNNLLHPSQHGFRKKRSTQTALIKVVDNWLTNIDKGQVTAVVFLDLAKAFDTVKHNILVRKLETLGLVLFISRQPSTTSFPQLCTFIDRTLFIRSSPGLLPGAITFFSLH